MSGTDQDDVPPMPAAEYVLGTLDVAEAEAARARAGIDPAFAAEIRAWERRLYPLTALAPPVAPPASLWARIEDSTHTGTSQAAGAVPSSLTPPANDNRVGFWRTLALASMAVAASLAVYVATRPGPHPAAQLAFAVLSPTGTAAPLLVAFSTSDGTTAMRPSGAFTVAAGHDLELWSLPAGASRPASLGLLPPNGKQLPPGIAIGTQLLVSLEPKGGSPTGQPTGPVVYGGILKAL